MPSAFAFQKGDDDWAAKRKASAHAFSRERLSNVLEVLKDQMTSIVNQWLKEIESNPDKKTVIDIAVVFEEILTANILTFNFGEDISKIPIEMDMREESTGSNFKLVRKTVTLGKALKEVVDQLCMLAGVKWMNPFY